MNAYSQLPEGYRELLKVDLQKNKKIAFWINFFALLIGLAMAVPMHFFHPIQTLFSMDKGLIAYSIRFGVLLIAMILYIILHELVHGAAMKICGTKKVKYGFTGLYAFAGSDDLYDKTSYIFIALAPIVLWGVVLAVLQFLVPAAYFWVVYFIQISNISGAAGDLYVTAKFSKLPPDILVQDYGVGMTVYSKQQ